MKRYKTRVVHVTAGVLFSYLERTDTVSYTQSLRAARLIGCLPSQLVTLSLRSP